MFRSDMYDFDAHPQLREASLAARAQLQSLARLAYGTEDPYAEVTLWAYIHGLATLVLDGPSALGAGDEVQRSLMTPSMPPTSLRAPRSVTILARRGAFLGPKADSGLSRVVYN